MIIHTGNHCNSNCRHVSRTCSCTSVDIIVFFFVVDLRGGITRSDSESEDRRIERLLLLFALPFPSIAGGLLIFFMLMLLVQILKSEESKCCFCFLFALPLPALVAYFFMLNLP